MNRFPQKPDRFADDQSGLTAIEFSLIGAIVSIAVVAALESFGGGSVLAYAGVAIDWCVALVS